MKELLMILSFIVVIFGVYITSNSIENFGTPLKENPRLAPANFEIGLDDKPLTKSANLANENEMYSLKPILNVWYGYETPNCACLEFNQAP